MAKCYHTSCQPIGVLNRRVPTLDYCFRNEDQNFSTRYLIQLKADMGQQFNNVKQSRSHSSQKLSQMGDAHSRSGLLAVYGFVKCDFR